MKNGTCTNKNTDYAPQDQFICSECGIELRDWGRIVKDDDGEEYFTEYEFRYCPNCGKEIKEREQDGAAYQCK